MTAFQEIEEVSDRHLHIFWMNADPEAANNMVFMYGRNAMLRHWWDKVTIVLWGSTQKLVLEDERTRANMDLCIKAGVEFSACIGCAANLGIREQLEKSGIECIPWGEKLSELMQNGKHVFTV